MNQRIKFQGGTMFVDGALHAILVHYQSGLTTHKTIASKLAFKQEMAQYNMQVKTYHTNNGVYTSKAFMDELCEKGHGMQLSGVSAQFQNGVAENAVKTVIQWRK